MYWQAKTSDVLMLISYVSILTLAIVEILVMEIGQTQSLFMDFTDFWLSLEVQHQKLSEKVWENTRPLGTISGLIFSWKY